MPALQCNACDKPVFHFSSILELGEPGVDPKIKRAMRNHRPKCSGKKPTPLPRALREHRYTDGRPFATKPKGPCAICSHGARYYLHYDQDGRYL